MGFLYGPVDQTRSVPSIRYGVIGTEQGVRRFRQWSERIRGLVDIPRPGPRSRAVEPQHVLFPGFAAAFHADLPQDPACVICDISSLDIDHSLRLENRHEAVHETVDLFVSRLIAENNRMESPPALWFVVVPEIVYRLGRPRSVVRKADRIAGKVTISLNLRVDFNCNQLYSATKSVRLKYTSMQHIIVAS